MQRTWFLERVNVVERRNVPSLGRRVGLSKVGYRRHWRRDASDIRALQRYNDDDREMNSANCRSSSFGKA
jgi:hypothetical protein